jgi:hypothetical protein
VTWTVSNGGQLSYFAWYEWYPNPPVTFEGFTVNEGDVIQLSVYASDPYNGWVYVTDTTTGQSVQHQFTNMQGLCGATVR